MPTVLSFEVYISQQSHEHVAAYVLMMQRLLFGFAHLGLYDYEPSWSSSDKK